MTPSSWKRILSLSNELELISFRNMIGFYKDELLKIWKGTRAVELLNTWERKSLCRKGILKTCTVKGGRANKQVILTEKALAALRKLTRRSK